MTLSVLGPFASVTSTVTTVSINSLEEDPSKKIRKPYTITKSRESWTDPEHDKFLEALHLFNRDWKKIEAFVGSKTVIQIRSHAQKYFLKVQKSGTNEHLPPPRPKRKAAHPYPQKASKYDSLSMLKSPTASASISTWTNNSVRTAKISHGRRVPTLANNSCSSTKSTPTAQRFGEKTDQGNESHQLRVLPDFA